MTFVLMPPPQPANIFTRIFFSSPTSYTTIIIFHGFIGRLQVKEEKKELDKNSVSVTNVGCFYKLLKQHIFVNIISDFLSNFLRFKIGTDITFSKMKLTGFDPIRSNDYNFPSFKVWNLCFLILLYGFVVRGGPKRRLVSKSHL